MTFDYYEEIAYNLRVQRRKKNKQLNIAQAIIETCVHYRDSSVKYIYIDDNGKIKLEIVVLFET